jgi:hypothetical protein
MVIADAHGLDAIPYLHWALDNERGDHLDRHSAAYGIQCHAVNMELGIPHVHISSQRLRLQLDLHKERPLVEVRLRQDRVVHRPCWHDPLH